MILPILASAILTTGAQAPSIEPDLDVALGVGGLNSRTARFDQNLLRLIRQGEFTTPLYDSLYENPWRTPLFAENLRNELAVSGSKPQESLSSMARLLGCQVRRSLVGNPNQGNEDASKKAGALDALLADWKAKGWITSTVPSTAKIPKETQAAAALILSVFPRVMEFRRLATANVPDLASAYARFSKSGPLESDSIGFEAMRKVGNAFDLAYLCAGAFDLFAATQEAETRIASVDPTQAYEFKVTTRWGAILLTGGSPTTYGAEPLLLAIDTGGNDTYLNQPSATSATQPVSVVLDGAGADKYLSDAALATTPVEKWADRAKSTNGAGPASALFGVTALFDHSGDDLYRTARLGLGGARFGVAGIVDRDGADVYDAYNDAEGFATFGLGLIDDQNGNDKYFGFYQVQGCGQTRGEGILLDRTGDDQYVANDVVLDQPSAQSAEHNVSMAQGVGVGRRADYLDGHSFAGGVGALIDLSGADSYSSGVFGQGVGYWMGVGMLIDATGDDKRTGPWYVQGAAAHFAIGYLEDDGGSDAYTAKINMAQGAGHDFSFGALIDRGSDNDAYVAPNLSLGAGNANGIGWFVDMAGRDSYISSGVTLGASAEAAATSLRSRTLCLGVFMDLGGDDTYPAGSPWAKNGSRTAQVQQRGPTPFESQLGLFYDR